MNIRIVIVPLFFSLLLVACGGSDSGETAQRSNQQQESEGLTAFELEHGIGPVTERLELSEEIDVEMAAQGRSIYEMKCEACHNMEGRMVGPALGDVTERRSGEFIMNFILNPSGMIREHPEGQRMLQEYMTPMPFQNVAKDEARAILEHLRDYADSR